MLPIIKALKAAGNRVLSVVLRLTKVRGFRPTAAVINQNGGERHGESDDRVHF